MKRRGTVGAFKTLREKYNFIRFLVDAQKTVWYPVLFAALCVIAGTHNYTVYLPILWVLASFVLFSVLFTDDDKVFLPPLLMIFFALGRDTEGDAFLESNGDMLSFMDKNAFPQVILICVICVGAFVIRLIADGSVAAAFKKRRAFTWGIIALDVAFMFNGAFSPKYAPIDLAYGFLMVVGFTAVYFLVSGMLENSENVIAYACCTMVSTAYVAWLQIITVVAREAVNGNYFLRYNGIILINRDSFTLAWGVSTVVSGVFILGIPAAMYLARNCKHAWFPYFSSILFIIGTVIINTRSSMLVGTAVFILCAILLCINGKNRVQNRIFGAITLLLVIAGLTVAHFTVMPIDEMLPKLFNILRFKENADSGRRELWADGINDFLSSPVFGVGFNDGGYPDELSYNNFYSNMYHCIFVEFPGALGIVGCLAFLLHAVELAFALFKRFSINKLLLLLVPLMIIAMSLVDNFFFYLHFQIFYGTFSVIAQRLLDGKEQ